MVLTHMAFKLSSRKFLLRFTVISGFSLLLLILLMQAFLYWQFDEERIQTSLSEFIAPTGRILSFKPGIETSWLPRPTVTLKHMKLSEPHSTQTAMTAQEVDLGISWWSVFAGGKLSNVIFKQANLRLNQTPAGTWSVADLLQLKSKKPHFINLNNITIKNSTIEVGETSFQSPFRVEDINLSLNDLHRASGELKASATLLQGVHRISLQINSPIQTTQQQFSLPKLNTKATSRMIQYGQTSLNMQTQISYLRDRKQLIIQDLNATLNMESPTFSARLNIPTGSITAKKSDIPIIGISAKLAQANVVTKWVAKLQQNLFSEDTLKINNAQIQTEIKTPERTLTFNAVSQLRLSTQGQYLLDNLTFTTRQFDQNHLAAKLDSNLKGILRGVLGKGFEFNAEGVFEGSSTKVELTAQNGPLNTYNFNVILDKLDSTPYLIDNTNHKNNDTFSDLFGSEKVINLDFLAGNNIEGNVNIKHLILGQVSFQNTQAHILATPKGITINDTQANIYQGKLSGTLSLEAGPVPKLTLDQTLIGMSIQPLLQDLFGYQQLTGRGNARVLLSTKGQKLSQMRNALTGDISLELAQGALLGIDLTDTVHNLPNKLTLQNEKRVSFNASQTTKFSQLKANIHFADGVARNKDLRLRSDLIFLTGEGKLDLKRQIVEYTMHIKANPSKLSQFKDINIPLQITGPIAAPIYSLDYNTLTRGKVTPEEKQRVLKKELTKQLGSFINP